jgi:tail tube protein
VALNKKIAVVAFDKQTSFGTLAANRKYGFGVRSGSILNAGLDQQYEELTTANRFPPSAYRSGFLWTVDCVSRAWGRSVVMLLENALGGRVTTGAADPFTHTITPADVPGYLTAATRLDTEYHKIRDCRVDELSFSWNQAEPVEMGLRMMGTVGSPYTTSGDPTTDDSDQQSFYPAGGVFQIDSDSITPVTADITGGSITIANHLEPVRVSRQLEPIDVWPGFHEITVTLRLIPTNTTLWRSVVTGADAGTAVSNAPVYGSFHTLFTVTAGTRDLDMTATRIGWTGDYPDPDPAGGPVEIELTGTVVKPAAAAFTAVVHNQEAASNYAGS